MKWWKDWRGECVAIVASGPSTKKEVVEALKGRMHVVAIKANVDLCPWADVVYGCDEPWWTHRRGLPGYRGTKIAYDPKLRKRFPDINLVEVDANKDNLLLTVPGTVGGGGNSGFQAFNLAIQFGATGICLIGFDMNPDMATHWYGRNTWPRSSNPLETNYSKWRRAFGNSVSTVNSLGVDVVNLSEMSSLGCFPKAKSVEQVFNRWGL